MQRVWSMKLADEMRDAVRAAAIAAGVSDSAWVREAIAARLDGRQCEPGDDGGKRARALVLRLVDCEEVPAKPRVEARRKVLAEYSDVVRLAVAEVPVSVRGYYDGVVERLGEEAT